MINSVDCWVLAETDALPSWPSDWEMREEYLSLSYVPFLAISANSLAIASSVGDCCRLGVGAVVGDGQLGTLGISVGGRWVVGRTLGIGAGGRWVVSGTRPLFSLFSVAWAILVGGEMMAVGSPSPDRLMAQIVSVR